LRFYSDSENCNACGSFCKCRQSKPQPFPRVVQNPLGRDRGRRRATRILTLLHPSTLSRGRFLDSRPRHKILPNNNNNQQCLPLLLLHPQFLLPCHRGLLPLLIALTK